MHRFIRFTLAATFVVAAALATASAEPGAPHDPPGVAANTVALALHGYSPVSYLDLGKAEPGSPRHAAKHEGLTYFFTSARQRRTFLANPDRYRPAYGGYCAYGCAVGAKVPVDPENFKVVGGRTFLFLRNEEVDTLALWNKGDESALRAKADRFWAAQGRSRAYLHARNVPASGIALDGYSPVSYFTAGRAEKGDPRFRVEHEGVIYLLTSPEQKKLFEKNPDKYAPQCGGWCAFGMSVQDKFPVDPQSFKIIDGGLYLFLNNADVDARKLWEQGEEARLLRKARAHWREVSGG